MDVYLVSTLRFFFSFAIFGLSLRSVLAVDAVASSFLILCECFCIFVFIFNGNKYETPAMFLSYTIFRKLNEYSIVVCFSVHICVIASFTVIQCAVFSVLILITHMQ